MERLVAPNLKNTLALPDYSLEVTYLGDGKVAKDATYRCTFELVEAVDPPVAVAADAAIPAASAGKKYRILVHDNHAGKSTETGGMSILGAGADTISKPKCYETNNWIRDVRPALGLRVTIKKWAAGVQVTLSPDEVAVSWKVADPEEEFDQVDCCRNGARPKQFLKDFFKHFKRKTGDAGSKVDDNCSTPFGGVRLRDGVVDARDVLFETPFASGAAAAGAGKLARLSGPADLSKSDPRHGRLAKSPVKPDTAADGKPIGVSDVYFYPPAISGDNYAFSIGLVSSSGARLDFLDPDNKRIQAYETGPFTMWRKVTIDMMVTFDNVDLNYIVWDDVIKAYRAAFIEVVQPAAASIVKYDEAKWKTLVKNYLRGVAGPGGNVGVGLTAVQVNAAVFDYATYFLPELTAATITAQLALPQFLNWKAPDLYKKYGKELAMLFLDEAYSDKAKTSPRTDLVQDTAPGLYIFLCKRLQDGVGLLGQYMGDREFFMVTVGDATCTFAHEMGHAVYLRHALTSFDGTNNITRDIAHTRGAWLDHDQGDAIICTMSYENDYYGPDGVTKRAAGAVEWHFCAVCLLKLRFWDTVALRKNRQFRKMIYSNLPPLKLGYYWYDAVDVKFENPHLADLANFNLVQGNSASLLCYAKAEAATNNSGGPFKKDVTNMTDGIWKSSVPGRAAFTSPPVAPDTYYNFAVQPSQLTTKLKTGKTDVRCTVNTDELKSNKVTVTVKV